MARKVCSECGMKDALISTPGEFVTLKGRLICHKCIQPYLEEIRKIIFVTTPNLEDWKITDYLGVGCSEIVVGTGAMVEFMGNVADFFGERSTGFEKRLHEGLEAAIMRLKVEAYELDANAIIGADIDYTEFSGNRIGVIANGTFVKAEKVN